MAAAREVAYGERPAACATAWRLFGRRSTAARRRRPSPSGVECGFAPAALSGTRRVRRKPRSAAGPPDGEDAQRRRAAAGERTGRLCRIGSCRGRRSRAVAAASRSQGGARAEQPAAAVAAPRAPAAGQTAATIRRQAPPAARATVFAAPDSPHATGSRRLWRGGRARSRSVLSQRCGLTLALTAIATRTTRRAPS